MWVALAPMQLCMLVQYRGGGEPSDAALASALSSVHSQLWHTASSLGEENKFSFELMPEATLHRYLSTCMRQKRVLDMQVRADERDARHPPTEPGALIAECPICASGVDEATLDPPPPVEAAASSAEPATAPAPPLVRPVSVWVHARAMCQSFASL